MFSKIHQYTLVNENDKKEYTVRSSNFQKALKYALLISVCFLAGMAGFWAAGKVAKAGEFSHGTLALEDVAHTFHYNRSFSYPPSNHTNKSWRQIFPKEGGFFVHPTIAPTRSTFSVFHQLHCLNGIRGGYWLNHEAAVRGEKLNDDDVPEDISPSHVRHCIDLLRQTLMCHGDTTIEVVDESINGVHGFRTEHQCKNWKQLTDWTTAQQQIQHVEQIV